MGDSGGRALAVGGDAAAGRSLPRRRPAPVRTVPFVDLDRYAGDWFEIARFPNRFQRQCVGDVRASYARRADGRIDVVNRCRTDDGRTEARGIARVVDERTFARLKVRFAPAWLSLLPFVWGDYWIIGLAEDYSWAVVGIAGPRVSVDPRSHAAPRRGVAPRRRTASLARMDSMSSV